MAYTLQDFAQLAGDNDLKKGVIDVFRREAIVMDQMSFEDVSTLSVQIQRTKSLPSVTWRKIGGTWSDSKATFEPVSDNLYQMGGKIDIDKVLVKAQGPVDQRAVHTDAYLTAIAYEFNDKFINGSPLIDEDAIAGMFYRIQTYFSGQHINENGLDVSPDSAGLAAAQITLIDELQRLIHKCDGHKADVIYSNETFLLRLCAALRGSGLLDTTQDNYDRWIFTYGANGPKLYDIGPKADQSTFIITNTELNNGTALTGGGATSCYAVKYGEKYLMGMQLYSIDVQDMGLLEDGVNYRTVVDWPVGIYIVNPRSVARMSGVIAA